MQLQGHYFSLHFQLSMMLKDFCFFHPYEAKIHGLHVYLGWDMFHESSGVKISRVLRPIALKRQEATKF